MIARLQKANGDLIKDVELDDAEIFGEQKKHQSPPDGLLIDGRAFFYHYKDEGVAIYRHGRLHYAKGVELPAEQ